MKKRIVLFHIILFAVLIAASLYLFDTCEVELEPLGTLPIGEDADLYPVGTWWGVRKENNSLSSYDSFGAEGKRFILDNYDLSECNAVISWGRPLNKIIYQRWQKLVGWDVMKTVFQNTPEKMELYFYRTEKMPMMDKKSDNLNYQLEIVLGSD